MFTPIIVPNYKVCNVWSSWEEELFDIEEHKMVPPHKIMAKRFNRKMAFSVCTGKGRTLEGCNLSKFGNSILQITGFLETY